MPIANFLNPIEEEATDQVFTDEELVTLAQTNPEEDAEQEEVEDLPAIPITQVFPKAEQIKFLTIVTVILEERLSEHMFSLLDLKRIQSTLRTELREEKEAQQEQHLITKYFS